MKGTFDVQLSDLVEQVRRDQPHKKRHPTRRPAVGMRIDPYEEGIEMAKRSAAAFREALERASN